MLKLIKLLALAVAAMLGAVPALAADKPQEWELINPTGAVETSSIDPAPRLTTLEGKTVVLRWNGKNNGNVLLGRLAELLAKRFPDQVVKSFEWIRPECLLGQCRGVTAYQHSSERYEARSDIASQATGASALLAVVDQSNSVKAGIPTVTIATTDCVTLARAPRRAWD
jgi:hypothetical protein